MSEQLSLSDKRESQRALIEILTGNENPPTRLEIKQFNTRTDVEVGMEGWEDVAGRGTYSISVHRVEAKLQLFVETPVGIDQPNTFAGIVDGYNKPEKIFERLNDELKKETPHFVPVEFKLFY